MGNRAKLARPGGNATASYRHRVRAERKWMEISRRDGAGGGAWAVRTREVSNTVRGCALKDTGRRSLIRGWKLDTSVPVREQASYERDRRSLCATGNGGMMRAEIAETDCPRDEIIRRHHQSRLPASIRSGFGHSGRPCIFLRP